jgi:hypothetical protein
MIIVVFAAASKMTARSLESFWKLGMESGWSLMEVVRCFEVLEGKMEV